MSTQTNPKLPIIEFTDENMRVGTASWRTTSYEVRRGLEEYGCFAAVYDKVSWELRDAMFKHCKHLFELPLETKLRNTCDVYGFGYAGNFATMPLAEYFGIKDGVSPESTINFSKQMWPDADNTHNFCEDTSSYSKLVSQLDQVVMRMVLESYGLDKYYDPLIQSSSYLLRFIKYRTPKSNETKTGHLPHRDKSLMGIVDTNQVGGLEMETRDGKWITFQPSSSKTIVFIAGEPFMAWSNGRIYAPVHRVMMKGSEDKYSVALFSFLRGTVEIPEELVDDDNPLKFKPFDNFEFLRFCANGGWKEASPINAFCGV
nr:probable 2-oxoglutarate-dependent dioxygenase AOP1 [Ipomoea trifida]